jgi:hypothetical protein
MEEKFKITATLQELKQDEDLWRVLVLNTIASVKSEEDGYRFAKMIEDFSGEKDSAGMLHASMGALVKTYAGNLLILLSRFFEAVSFQKKEFIEALAYNYDILQQISLGILGDKEQLKKALEEVLSEDVPKMLMEMLVNRKKVAEEEEPKESIH